MNQKQIFNSLAKNAFDFLKQAIEEFDKSPKYSVIHFCAAVEMILKARLMTEHWSLIVSKPEQANLVRFLAGEFASVTMDESRTRLRDKMCIRDSLSADDYENFEEEVVDQATAAQTIQELEAEIIILEGLEDQAKQVVHSGQDRKWDELSKLLQNTPEMQDADGRQRKLIIFTEHRDTLSYLATKIRGLIGSEESVVLIHGGVKREERRKVQELFRNDPSTRVLIATDAAGEGVNLQNRCV